jgi:DNA mismatch repair protein MutS2
MSEVLAARDEASTLRVQLESERDGLTAERTKLEKERSRVGSSFREELDRLRDDVQRQVAAEIKNLRESDRNARASVNAAEIVRTLTKPVDKALDFLPAQQRDVHVGEKAEHRSFKVTGTIVSIDGKKAVLNVNGRRMTVEVKDLVPRETAPSPPPSRSSSRQPAADSLDTVVDAELNLIGQRVDEAIDESDRFLDRALLEGKQAVRLIHGFGTGILRKALREHLRKHPAVKSWRPGGENEGGDGATIAVLS